MGIVRVGYNLRQIDDQLTARLQAQPCVVMCAKCPDWRFEGTVAEGRKAFKRHSKTHTDAPKTQPRNGVAIRWTGTKLTTKCSVDTCKLLAVRSGRCHQHWLQSRRRNDA